MIRCTVIAVATVGLILNGASSYLKLRNRALRDSWWSAMWALLCAFAIVSML